MYGKKYLGPLRAAYLFDGDGKLLAVIPKVEAAEHGSQVPADRDVLETLPGVGRKTSACVLLFAYARRDVPVDTHVSRVGTRLRLLRPGAPFDELHDEMLRLTPPGAELELHVNLLRHGRRTCHARNPACRACARHRRTGNSRSPGIEKRRTRNSWGARASGRYS